MPHYGNAENPGGEKPTLSIAIGRLRKGASKEGMPQVDESSMLPEPLENGLSELVEKKGYDRDYWISSAVEELLKSEGVMVAEDAFPGDEEGGAASPKAGMGMEEMPKDMA